MMKTRRSDRITLMQLVAIRVTFVLMFLAISIVDSTTKVSYSCLLLIWLFVWFRYLENLILVCNATFLISEVGTIKNVN